MRVLFFAYAVSGLIGLGYQVFWLRHFVDRFGSSTFTFVLVISSFILGLGAGALASRRFVERLQRIFPRANDLVLYGMIELTIAAAVLLVFVEALLPPNLLGPFPYVDHGGIYEPRLAFHLVRLPLAAACVLVPCFFMGTTFPLLCRAFLDRPRLPSALYAWNTLGACLAVLLCEFVLVRRWGTDTMLWIVLALNVLLGVAFLIGGGRLLERCKLDRSEAERVPDRARAAGRSGAPVQALFLGALLSGFLSGALEADAFRRVHFAQIYNGSAMAFVSFWAIAAIFISSSLVHRLPRMRLAHVKLAFGAAFVVYVIVTRFGLMPALHWVQALAATAPGRYAWDPDGQLTVLAAVFAIVGLIVFPTYACVSLLLPRICNDAQRAGRHLGALYGANMFAFLGGMIVFSWLAPAVNMFYAFWLCTFCFAAGVVLLFFLDAKPTLRRLGTSATLAALGIAALMAPRSFDHSLFPEDYLRHWRVRALRGSPGFTTFVAETPQGDAVFLDTAQMSNTSPRARRYMKLMAHFPLLAQERPERALLICYGVGNTAAAIGKHATVKEIDIVDLSRNIFETAPEFVFFNDAIDSDPRVRRIHDDGRSFLAVTDRRYDLITSEPPPPLMDGINRLYSAEYYRDVLRHLTPGGCMTQWLPIFQMPPTAGRLIVSTFVRSFPHTLLLTGFDEELLLVGSNAPFDFARIARRYSESPSVRGDLSDIQVPSAVSLLARIVRTDPDLSKDFKGSEWISDQKNPLSSFWPTGQKTLAFPYEPEKVLAAFSPELLASEPELRPTLLDPHRLCRAAPDFPAVSLAAGPHGAALDWLALERTNKSAEELLKQGDVQRSSQLFDRSLELFPEQLRVLLLVGGVALARQPAEALPWFRRCVETLPEYQDGYYGLAVALVRSGDFEGAIKSASAALAINPRFYEAHILMAQILEHLGRSQEAQAQAAAARDLKPMVGLPPGIMAAPAR